MNDPLPSSELTVGEALLSPTRTYLPLIKKISEEIGKELKGAVHCSGGGQTKCLRFGTEVKYVKDNLFTPPPIFSEIQKMSKTSPKEMHQVYNMGHRLEGFCKPELERILINLAKEFEIKLSYCFGLPGVMKDIKDSSSLIEKIDQKSYETLLLTKAISAGILPKLHNAFDALNSVGIGIEKLSISIMSNSTTNWNDILF